MAWVLFLGLESAARHVFFRGTIEKVPNMPPFFFSQMVGLGFLGATIGKLL
jgi:hypothetical protein